IFRDCFRCSRDEKNYQLKKEIMIIGVGVDIVNVNKFQRAINKWGDTFIHRIFTSEELKHISQSNKIYHQRLAARFAAKEATAKALAGTHTGALSWHDVEVVNHPSGKPEIRLHGEALKRIEAQVQGGQNWKIHLSLTDDYPYAQAFAIVEIL
ncbi:MAG: holo-ACP synthase, partial [Robiginitomaculum sp.]|nr:holo-ACP synthase [Robiginitomaculum sp.]